MARIFKNNFFSINSGLQDVAYVHYASCFRVGSYYGCRPCIGLEFEKRLCRSGSRKSFGSGLPHCAHLQYGLTLDLDQGLTTEVAMSRSSRPYPYKAAKVSLRQSGASAKTHFKGAGYSLRPKKALHLKPALNLNGFETRHQRTIDGASEVFKKSPGNATAQNELYLLGLHQPLTSAYWLCAALKKDFQCKKSPRALLNNLFRDVAKIMTRMKGGCPVLGLRVVASGRLGKRKKGMAQQIRRGIGKVPLSTLKAKVDYCQDVVTSPRGAIGLKVWICYA